MLRLIAAALVTGLVVSGPVMAQKKDCGELKGEIEAKIKKNGVEKFSLDVVDADKSGRRQGRRHLRRRQPRRSSTRRARP